MIFVAIPNTDIINMHRRSLATEIKSLYGRDIWQQIQLLEKLRVKIQRRVADLTFLKNCRDLNLIPTFAVINHRMRSKWNMKAFDKLSMHLVKLEIKKTRFNLDHLARDSLKLHLKLAATIRQDLWLAADSNAALKAERELEKTRTKHHRKILKMQAQSMKKQQFGNMQVTIEESTNM